ncbi:MAG: RNA methyltransferase substrate-binding domain-containing protein, partial [Oscillospiraceae bacterium]
MAYNNKNYGGKPRRRSDKPLYTEKEDVIREDNAENQDKGYIIGRNPVIEALKSGKNIDTIYVNSEAGGSIGL